MGGRDWRPCRSAVSQYRPPILLGAATLETLGRLARIPPHLAIMPPCRQLPRPLARRNKAAPLPAAGDGAGGGRGGHGRRPVAAVAAGRLVAGGPGGLRRLVGPVAAGPAALAAAAILLAAAATAASWHHARWYLFAADDLGQFARDATQPVCVEVRVVKGRGWFPRPTPAPWPSSRSSDLVRMEVERAGRPRRRPLGGRPPAVPGCRSWACFPRSRRATGCGCLPT